MTTLPKLFSRNSNGSVQQWQIFVNGDQYYTEYGQIGGKIQGTLPTTCLPTNEGRANARTSEQQALSEAQALWDKKKKSEGYFETLSEIDNETFVQPMLAKKYDDHKKKLKFPCVVQNKYNGCLHADTLVEFEDGSTDNIKNVVNNQTCKKIKCFNVLTDEVEYKNVADWMKNGKSIGDDGDELPSPMWYRVTMVDGSSIFLYFQFLLILSTSLK